MRTMFDSPRRSPLLVAAPLFLAIALAAPAPAQESSPYGINVHAPAGTQLALLDEVADAGIGWIRIDLVWAAVETQRGVYDWRLYDALLAAAEQRGLQVLAILAYTPQWATDGPVLAGVPRDGEDWRRFCTRAATRYRGRIRYWEVWNEPNLPKFWAGTRQQYRDLILVPGAAALRAADPQARIVGPALAHLGSAEWYSWLLDILEHASDSIDVVSHHLYDGDGFRDVTEKLDGSTPFANDPSLWDLVAPSVREVLKEAGARDKPFWLTETGWQSSGSGTAQAADYGGLLVDWLSGREPTTWIDKVFFYELQDNAGFTWGILDAAGNPKPAHQTYRDFIVAHPPSPPLLLQGGRFAVSASWRDRDGNSGAAQPMPYGEQTGWFWFFAEENLELLVKLLDGTAVNGKAWVFWGALSDVEYWLTVTDRASRVTRRYHNPAGTFCGDADTSAFPWAAAPASYARPALASPWRRAADGVAAGLASPSASSAAAAQGAAAAAELRVVTGGSCVPGPTTACVGDGRFRIETEWHVPGSGARGVGHAAGALGDSAAFWFFDASNLELAVKVLDGRLINGRFWTFFGALSDVEYWVTVTDTVTGANRRYHNSPGTLCGQADVEAF